jgi:hypothetical protein
MLWIFTGGAYLVHAMVEANSMEMRVHELMDRWLLSGSVRGLRDG